MAVRNAIFKFVNLFQNFKSQQNLGFLHQRNIDNQANMALLKKRFEFQESNAQLQRQLDNMVKATRESLTGQERVEFDILHKYHTESQDHPEVDANDILLEVDKIELINRLKIVELNYAQTDPELVRYEKLRARALLEEPGAAEEYKEYVANRAFSKKFESWTTGEDVRKQEFMS